MTTPPEKPNSSSSNTPKEGTTSGNPTTSSPVAGIDADDVLTAKERAADKSEKSRSDIFQQRESQELKVIALNVAAHVTYETIDDYLAGSQKVYDWLAE